jgi:hypothetical protein
MILLASSSVRSDLLSLSVTVRQPIVLSLLRVDAPPLLRGLITLVTPGCSCSDLTVLSTAVLFFESVSFPLFAWSTIGLVPFAWLGSLSWSRSWAFVEPVPGSVRLWLVCEPATWETASRPTARPIQAAITIQWRRALKRPTRYRGPVIDRP